MKKNNIHPPHLPIFYSYDYKFRMYLENLRRAQVELNSSKISRISRNSKILMIVLSILGMWSMSNLGISVFLYWIPVAISIFIGMIVESFFIHFIPNIKYVSKMKKFYKETEEKELRKKIENLKPPVFDYDFVLKQIQDYSCMEISELLSENFKAICEDMRNLVLTLRENNIDINKYSTLFQRYIPDIIGVLNDYDKSDADICRKVNELLRNFHMFMLSEIEYACMGRKMSTNATIDAYNNLFKGTTFGG